MFSGEIRFEGTNLTSGWAGTSRRPANWTISSYVDQWTQYATAIRDSVNAQPDVNGASLHFQGCAFTAPRGDALRNSSTTWSVANAVRLGLGKSGMLQTVADHDVRCVLSLTKARVLMATTVHGR